MGQNLLTGTIPKELGNLTNLQGIVLQYNQHWRQHSAGAREISLT